MGQVGCVFSETIVSFILAKNEMRSILALELPLDPLEFLTEHIKHLIAMGVREIAIHL